MHNWKGLIYTNEIKMCTSKMFEDIKHVDKSGNEYLKARELQNILEYNKWDNFHKVIKQAIVACKNSGVDTIEQFAETRKLSINVNGGQRRITDYNLSRYACYLIAQNGDSRKKSNSTSTNIFCNSNKKARVK